MTDEFERSLQHLREDRRQGASALARQALTVLCRSVESLAGDDVATLRRVMAQRCEQLRSVRPSMAVIDRLLGQWQQQVAGAALSHAELSALMIDRARQLIAQSCRAQDRCARHAAARIRRGQTVISHSRSSTVMKTFEHLAGREVRVIISESRPLNEGVTVARQLQQWGLEVTLITDAQLGLFAAQADMALVGADSLLADGSVVNKAGTLLLALASDAAHIPFYVCCESDKRCPLLPEQLTLEAMAPQELGHELAAGPGRVQVENIYFDITPAALVTGVFDETGLQLRHEER